MIISVVDLKSSWPAYLARSAYKCKMETRRTNYAKQMEKYCLPAMSNEPVINSDIDIIAILIKDLRDFFSCEKDTMSQF